MQGEIVFALQEEMAQNLRDVFRRRMPLVLLASRSQKEKMIPVVTRILGDLGWQIEHIMKECKLLEA